MTLERPASPVLTPPQTRTAALFSAMRVRNFRLYSAGQSFANTGTWMQSIAQDWLVLELTNSPAAVGITMSMQFLPMLLLGVHGGALADRFDKRRLLIATQLANGVLTGLLAVLTLTGHINAFEVYGFALAGGFVFVVDSPARQVFVNELVPADQIRNAIGLNAAVFQATRLFGPAIAGVLINGVGTGWAFAATSVCYLGPVTTLMLIDRRQLIASTPVPRSHGQVRDTLRYVAGQPQLAWTLLLVGMVGMLGLNFPIVLTGIARDSFHGTAALYGLFNIMLAIGSMAGALVAGSRTTVRMRQVVAGAALFGVAEALAALAPDLTVFLVLLAVMGMVNLAFQSMANSSVQLSCDPAYRSRVMGLYMLVFVGGTPIGAPIIGVITAELGARAGMLACGVAPALTAVAVGWLLSTRSAQTAPATS